jgi:uncharacterized membrane protein YbhN (UPF0104 family)
MQKNVRSTLSIFLLLIALMAAFFYLAHHHSLMQQLVHTPFWVSALVFFLYIAMFGALVLILSASVKICGKKFSEQENTVLNAHSLFINFFIPGQGGPAYRGAYMYKRHKLRIINYIAVTLLYYAFYAAISVGLLFWGSKQWWQTLGAVILALILSAVVINQYAKRKNLHKNDLALSSTNLLYLLGATLLQTIIQLAIYSVELHSVNHHIVLSQVIIYTGAANLALFAALTPGAIGIRESFLIFTERLHHISSGSIVTANLIDRSVYIVFLLGLMVLTITLHARGKFQLKNLPAQLKQSLKLSYLYKS